MARLVVVDGPDKGASHGLGDEVTLGRTIDCQVRLVDTTVSRRHARLERVAEGYVLTPLALANITALNNSAVRTPVPVRDGDLIRLGGTVLKLTTSIVPPPAGVTLADAKSYEEIVRSLPTADSPFDTSPSLKSLGEAERFVAALQAINAISRAIAAVLDVDELLEKVMASVLELFPSARRINGDDDAAREPRARPHRLSPQKGRRYARDRGLPQSPQRGRGEEAGGPLPRRQR